MKTVDHWWNDADKGKTKYWKRISAPHFVHYQFNDEPEFFVKIKFIPHSKHTLSRF